MLAATGLYVSAMRVTAPPDPPPTQTHAWVWNGVLLYAPPALTNTAHAHFPATLLIAVERPFALTIDGQRRYHEIALLAPNLRRETDSEGQPLIDLLVDPDDDAYRWLHPLLQARPLVSLPGTQLDALRPRFADVLGGRLGGCGPARDFVRTLLQALNPQPLAELPWDARVRAATRALRTCAPTQLPSAGAIAAGVGLSESRFSHLFREQLGLPLRQYLLWLRIRHAMRLWAQGRTLAEIATGAGFYDHAHFTRTLRRMTDYAPSMLTDPRSVLRCDCTSAAVGDALKRPDPSP
jgi:AraC family transcriptional regulator, arabinose operon regulatory protein